VSADVAAALASGVRQRLGSDLGVGITGVAGPEAVGEDPAGTVFLAVAGARFAEVSRVELVGSRAEIRATSVDRSLTLLNAVLSTLEQPGIPGPLPGVTP